MPDPSSLEQFEPLAPGAAIGAVPKEIDRSEVLELDGAALRQLILECPLPLLVEFFSPDCGPCKTMAPVLGKLAAEYGEKMKVVKASLYDTEVLAVAVQYKVQGIPTVVMLRGGQELHRVRGFTHEVRFRQELQPGLVQLL